MKMEEKQQNIVPADVLFPLSNNDVELYHYTSLEALKSIVENRTLRLSDYRYVNDINEFNFCIKNFNEVFNEFNEEDIAPIKKALNDLQNGIDSNIKIVGIDENKQFMGLPQIDNDTHFYIFSMSTNCDSLPLWKMYGENGVRIKFNTKTLHSILGLLQSKYFQFGIINIAKGEVNYDEGLEYERYIVSSLINAKMKEGETMLYDILYRMCILRKDPCFNYEKEYRVGFKFFDKLLAGNKEIRKTFIIKNNTLIPQLELLNIPIADLFENVVISPYNKSDRAISGLKDFLQLYLQKDVEVNNSGISIR